MADPTSVRLDDEARQKLDSICKSEGLTNMTAGILYCIQQVYKRLETETA